MEVIIKDKFIGPHIENQRNFGLYAGDDLDLFTFFYKDSQEKLQI